MSEIIKDHLAGKCEAVISSVHWGEIAGQICKKRGRAPWTWFCRAWLHSEFRWFPWMRSARFGQRLIRLKTSIPYVDAFGVELTTDSRERVFVTADFDFKPARRDVKIEFCRRSKVRRYRKAQFGTVVR